jgi:PhzF family phenazine biosynthesis protein
VRSAVTWVDAFTAVPFAGNPAAVCVTEDPLDESYMQSLAFEFGISETAFVSPLAQPEGEYSLRWFTPTTEIDLCGHATLAAAHVLRERGLVGGNTEVGFHTRSGRLSANFDGEWIELDMPRAKAEPIEVPDALSFIPGSSIVQCLVGDFFFLVELTTADAVRSLVPDRAAMLDLPAQALLVTAASDSPDLDYVLRVFGPKVGIEEDPVTGSAPCLVGPYWAEKLGQTELRSLQVSERTGRLRVRVGPERVKVAGQAVSVLTGEANSGV